MSGFISIALLDAHIYLLEKQLAKHIKYDNLHGYNRASMISITLLLLLCALVG